MPSGRCALKESGSPPTRTLYRNQRLDGVACWVDVLGVRRDQPGNRSKDPHIATKHPNLAHLCNVGRSAVIGKDGTQMLLDICTRISLASVESDQVAELRGLSVKEVLGLEPLGGSGDGAAAEEPTTEEAPA